MKKSKRVVLGPRSRRVAVPFGIVAVVGVLIYLEQIALLYVLATLALVALLLAVALSDLESVGKPHEESDQPRDDQSESGEAAVGRGSVIEKSERQSIVEVEPKQG